MANPNSSIAEDIIKRETEEGICVCGQKMRKVSEHLNYIVWKCEFCSRKETRMKGAQPYEAFVDKIGEYSSYLIDIVAETLGEKVISGKNERQTDKNKAELNDRWEQ